MPKRLSREEYTVGWVCALPIELAAATAMLDETHEDVIVDINGNDENVYCVGSIAGHNVAIVCLPAGQLGTNQAATVATQMNAAFTRIRIRLMVGIGGGVPGDVDIRLGDVVVSKPHQGFGGVVQYNFGKATSRGFERTGWLNAPPQILLSAINTVQANEDLREGTLSEHWSGLDARFQRSKAGVDVLFDAAYDHEGGDTCAHCSLARQQTRLQCKRGEEVVVHYGTIASDNQVIKNATERDKLSKQLGGVLCFEMEAAGLMNSFPCLVIRGICDYADSHKNKQWQPYAAGTAAVYAKVLLSVIPAPAVKQTGHAEASTRRKRSRGSSSPERESTKRMRKDNITSSGTGILDPTNCSTRPSLPDEQKQILLESLRFDEIDDRYMNIEEAHAGTCEWLLITREYLDWMDDTKLDEHHGLLWIKGNAGTGKSTLMKYAWTQFDSTMEDHIVLSFFFSARGGELEKSTMGTYRSLLLQLLQRLPALEIVFDSLRAKSQRFPADHQWTITSLEMLLEQAVLHLGKHPVVCFVDALDECKEQQIRNMIKFFEKLGVKARSNSIRFQVCFSSRHYPNVTIRKGLQLVLEKQEGHTQDIINYIGTELVDDAQYLRDKLREKASGIFMWVVLVVAIMNEEVDHGHIHKLHQTLQDIPDDLDELFRDILTRDSNNKDRLVLCIQWVLFAKQPLSPEELHHAILFGTDPQGLSMLDPKRVTSEIVRRFILDSSKGLAEITISEYPKVQFIHESVREFLLKEDGLGKIWPEYRSNFQGQSHERLKQCCLGYITIDVATSMEIPDDLLRASFDEAEDPFDEAEDSFDKADMRMSALQNFPFLEYAAQNVLYHADKAEEAGISQQDFLNSFPIPQWVKFANIFNYGRHENNVSLLYLLAEFDLVHLIGSQSLVTSYLEEEDSKYGCLLYAAIATRSYRVTKAFMDKIGMNWLNTKLAQQEFSCNFDDLRSRGFLSYAAELGLKEVVIHYIESGKYNIDSVNGVGGSPLWFACREGHVDVVQVLLDTGTVNIERGDVDDDGETPLYVAAMRGHAPVVQLLLDRGADVNTCTSDNETPLHAAAQEGHISVVQLLLEKGADANACDSDNQTPLHLTAERGDTAVVQLLLDNNADINVQGGYYGNALQAASSYGHIETVRLLLNRGADVNAQGGIHGNALQAAATRGRNNIVQWLLNKGADVNAKGTYFHTRTKTSLWSGKRSGWTSGNPLRAASHGGHDKTVQLLLENGADPDTGSDNSSGPRYLEPTSIW